MSAGFHKAENANDRGEGICRTCLKPIWNEGGTVGYARRDGWSDRVEHSGDSLVCFSAIDYRHVPLAGREACIYDHAFALGLGQQQNVDHPESPSGCGDPRVGTAAGPLLGGAGPAAEASR